MASSISNIRPSDVRRATGGLRFDRNIVGVGFAFEPSIGLVAKRIDKLGLEFKSFKDPLTKAIMSVMIPSFRKNFEKGGRPEPWEELAEYTIKARGYDAWPILVRTGKLKKAVTSLKIWDIGQGSAIVRSLPPNVWYGYVHQSGYGGFKQHMDAAKKDLGPRATPRQLTARAFQIVDERAAAGHAKVAIPQRQFVLYQDEDITKIQALFYTWLGDKVEKAQEREGL